MTRVLMVCTGNICRSPTAEAVLRSKLVERGLEERIEVDSAGTADWHVGLPPSELAVRLGAARGYDLTPLRARQLEAADYQAFDLILAMDRGHFELLERGRPPEARARIRLFMEFVADGPAEVPDPYYGGQAEYQYSLDLIEQAMPGLFDQVEGILVLGLIEQAMPGLLAALEGGDF